VKAEAAPGYIHGGSDEREVRRLEKQAQWAAPWMLSDFDVPPGARVLDLATGVGAMAGWLLERFVGIDLVGVDLSPHQLAWARRNHPTLRVLRADASRLPFADATFDRVHCSWLLEHVPAAVAVKILREVRRLLRPGGYCHFTEVDNSTFRTTPGAEEIQAVMAALNQTQLENGGDPYVGQKLPRYFAEAGFTRADIRPRPTHGGPENPVFFQGFIDEFAEIFESLDEALPTKRAQLQSAAAKLRGLKALGGSLDYAAVAARGFR
jgi:ubiquinone/menaquinone biosynthesis C-methylase UbiE